MPRFPEYLCHLVANSGNCTLKSLVVALFIIFSGPSILHQVMQGKITELSKCMPTGLYGKLTNHTL